MNDISYKKALALLNDVRTERGFTPVVELYGSVLLGETLCRAIKQHEAFRQEVSDAAREYEEAGYCMGWEGFERFIIPAPKPDPLVEVMKDLSWDEEAAAEEWANDLRAALEARGLTITTLEKD